MRTAVLAAAMFTAGFGVRNLLGRYYGRGVLMAVQMTLTAVVLVALIVMMAG